MATDAAPRLPDGLALPRLTGFENHGGVTTVGPGARPLARVVHGVGNGGGDGTEGAWQGRVLGSYLHGPLLARNTALADLLLGWALSPDRRARGAGGPRAPGRHRGGAPAGRTAGRGRAAGRRPMAEPP